MKATRSKVTMGTDYIHLWLEQHSVVYYYETIVDLRDRVQVAGLSLAVGNATRM